MVRAMQLYIGIVVLSLAYAAEAQKPIVYPAKGQSPQQQSQDDAQCAAWAKQSTGIDPAVVAANPPPQQTGPAVGGGQRVRGAARADQGAVGRLDDDQGHARELAFPSMPELLAVIHVVGHEDASDVVRGCGGHYGGRPASAPGPGGAESASASPAAGSDPDVLPRLRRLHGRPRLHHQVREEL